MKELIVFAGEILFMAVVIGMYDKSEKFQQKIKSIKLFIEKHECIFFISMIVITIMMSVGFINQGHDWGGDFSQYLAQTRAILNGTVEEQSCSRNLYCREFCCWVMPGCISVGVLPSVVTGICIIWHEFFCVKISGCFLFCTVCWSDLSLFQKKIWCGNIIDGRFIIRF